MKLKELKDKINSVGQDIVKLEHVYFSNNVYKESSNKLQLEKEIEQKILMNKIIVYKREIVLLERLLVLKENGIKAHKKIVDHERWILDFGSINYNFDEWYGVKETLIIK